MKKSSKGLLAFLIIFLVIAVSVVFYIGIQETVIGESTQTNFVLTPDRGRIQCEALKDTPDSRTRTFGDDESIEFQAGKLEFTPFYETFAISCSENAQAQFQFENNPQCPIAGYDDTWCTKSVKANQFLIITGNIQQGERVRARCRKITLLGFKSEFISGAIRYTYQPYGLVYHLEGAKQVYKKESCDLGDLERGKIEKGTCPYQTVIPFDEWCNFILEWNYGSRINIQDHPKYGDVFCAGTSIYDVGTLTMEDDTVVKTLGRLLPESVECCPIISGCGDDFKWTATPKPKECFSDAQCANLGVWTSHASKTIAREECIEGTCTQKIEEVECAYNYDCASGMICSTEWKCVNPVGIPCGDEKCQEGLGENKYTCPIDCGYPTPYEKCQSTLDKVTKTECWGVGLLDKIKYISTVLLLIILLVVAGEIFKRQKILQKNKEKRKKLLAILIISALITGLYFVFFTWLVWIVVIGLLLYILYIIFIRKRLRGN